MPSALTLLLVASGATIQTPSNVPGATTEALRVDCDKQAGRGPSLALARALRGLGAAREAEGATALACFDYGKCAQIAAIVDDPDTTGSCAREFVRCASEAREFLPQAHLEAAAHERQFDGDLAIARAELAAVAELCEDKCLDSVFWRMLKERLSLAVTLSDMREIRAVRDAASRRATSLTAIAGEEVADGSCEAIPDEAHQARVARASLAVELANTCVILDLFGPEPCVWDPRPYLEQAALLYPRAPATRWNHQNIAILRGWASALYGDTTAAIALVEVLARQPIYDEELRLWYHGLRLRLAIRGGAAWAWRDELKRMQAAVAERDDRPRPATLPRRWLSALWTGEALRDMGDRTGAITALEDAERLVDQMSLALELGAIRERAFASYDASKRGLADLYYESGRRDELVTLIRRSHARITMFADPSGGSLDSGSVVAAIAHLQSERAARQDVCLPGPFEPGRLELGLVRGNRRWIGVAVTDRDITVAGFDRGGLENATAAFDAPIAAAQAIHVLQDGSPHRIRVDLLPWRGIPLWQSREVFFTSVAAPRADAGPRESRCEVYLGAELDTSGPAQHMVTRLKQAVAAAWPDRRCPLTPPVSERLDADQVRRQLATADTVLLYAHGRYTASDRPGDPWTGALAFHESELAVRDLMALPQVPAWVVLTACFSASVGGQAPSALGGLGQVFVQLGTRGVVATSDMVDPEVGAALTAEIAQVLAEDERLELPAAFHRARLRLLRCGSTNGPERPAACDLARSAVLQDIVTRELAKFFVLVPASP